MIPATGQTNAPLITYDSSNKEQYQGQSPLGKLPLDLLTLIFTRVSSHLPSLACCAVTCRKFLFVVVTLSKKSAPKMEQIERLQSDIQILDRRLSALKTTLFAAPHSSKRLKLLQGEIEELATVCDQFRLDREHVRRLILCTPEKRCNLKWLLEQYQQISLRYDGHLRELSVLWRYVNVFSAKAKKGKLYRLFSLLSFGENKQVALVRRELGAIEKREEKQKPDCLVTAECAVFAYHRHVKLALPNTVASLRLEISLLTRAIISVNQARVYDKHQSYAELFVTLKNIVERVSSKRLVQMMTHLEAQVYQKLLEIQPPNGRPLFSEPLRLLVEFAVCYDRSFELPGVGMDASSILAVLQNSTKYGPAFENTLRHDQNFKEVLSLSCPADITYYHTEDCRPSIGSFIYDLL